MPRSYHFVIGPAEIGLRLDHFLVRRLPESMSRSMIQRAIEEERVKVNGHPAKAKYKLKLGDAVAAVFSQLGAQGGSVHLTPANIPVQIIYEDEWLLVVNKPAGLVTHPAPGHWDGTLVNALVWHFAEAKQLARAGIVHRLDKDTSGLLLVAKTEEAHIHLARQLKARDIHRRYLAVVEGHVALDRGTVNVPVGRHATNRKVMTVRHLGGRSAVTHYQVVSRLEVPAAKPKKPSDDGFERLLFPSTLLDISLDTGRTHQIRVHMAHLGHPVVGDLTYGNHPESYWRLMGIERHFLHAFALTFQHPASRKTVSLTAPVPAAIARWLPAKAIAQLTDARKG